MVSFGNILGGALTGFLTGGPVGAIVGGVAGALSRGSSAGGTSARYQLSATPEDLRSYLQRQAYLNGVRNVLGGLGGTAPARTALATGSSGPLVGGMASIGGAVATRRANQRGGRAFPYATGEGTQLLREYVAAGLAGVGGVQGNLQGQYTVGANAINAQARQAAGRLQEALARRGMLRSGSLATGLGQVEQGRLQALQGLYADIAAQRAAAAQAAQQQAAALMAASLGQTQQIAASQPTFADYLANLMGAYALYRARPQPFDFTPYLQPVGNAPAAQATATASGATTAVPAWLRYMADNSRA